MTPDWITQRRRLAVQAKAAYVTAIVLVPPCIAGLVWAAVQP